jgi:hypothetical protein
MMFTHVPFLLWSAAADAALPDRTIGHVSQGIHIGCSPALAGDTTLSMSVEFPPHVKFVYRLDLSRIHAT